MGGTGGGLLKMLLTDGADGAAGADGAVTQMGFDPCISKTDRVDESLD